MKISKYLIALIFLVALAHSVKCQPAKNDYWQNFIRYGANILSGYAPDTNSLVSTVPERASTVPERSRGAVPERSRGAVSERGFGGP
jgi:hypothetical protein